MDDASRGANATLTVDLEKQEIRGPDGGVIKFDIDSFRKHCLLNGLDNIGLTLEKKQRSTSFETSTASTRPWLLTRREREAMAKAIHMMVRVRDEARSVEIL